MPWSGELTVNSELKTKITFTPNAEPEDEEPVNNLIVPTSYAGTYTVTTFTAPKKAIYRFILKGAGGATRKTLRDGTASYGGSSGGQGGRTEGYLLLEENETVYIGAGGCCRASFVSKTEGGSLAAINKEDLYFVAGAGGNGGGWTDAQNFTGYNCKTSIGGKGGGDEGTQSGGQAADYCGYPGTQSAGGKGIKADTSVPPDAYDGSNDGVYGKGSIGGYASGGDHKGFGGRGGDGYYGGSGGGAYSHNTSSGDDTGDGCIAGGGGGGSGYVKVKEFTVGDKVYTSITKQGDGSGANTSGSVTIIYYADADLPILYNDKRIVELYFNDNKVNSLYFNDTKIY